VTALNALFVCGGAGGAGSTSADFAGGNITGAGVVTTISGGSAGANIGRNGLSDFARFVFTGGSGAGSSNSVNPGARGGDAGGYGCGGGGGGAGVTVSGGGGNGSPGLVVITVW
jgi:hypothetical protein